MQVLRAPEHRALSASYLKKKFEGAEKAMKALEKKGFIAAETTQDTRDPLRAASENLRIAAKDAEPAGKLPKAESELMAFLSLHPGTHNLADLEKMVKNASTAARALARK